MSAQQTNGQPTKGQPTSSWVLLIWPLAVLGVALLGTWFRGRPQDRVGEPEHSRAQIVSVAKDQSSVRLMNRPAPESDQAAARHTVGLTVPASPPDLRAALKSELEVGDLVEYKAASKQPPSLGAIEIDSEPTSVWIRWLTLAGAAALLALFFLATGTGPGALILGADQRYSKSKFQLVVWFGVVAVCYLSILWLRFCYSSNWLLGSVTIPTNLLALSGLSAVTFGGAKAITQSKENQQAALEAANPQHAASLRKTANPRPPSLLFDLVHDDAGSADLGDFQMVFITLLAAVTYLVQFVTYLSVLPLHAAVTIPDVDGTMLAIFGLGHGAYLTKKMASGPGAAGASGGNGGQAGGGAAPGGAAVPGGAPPAPGAAGADTRRQIGNEA